MSDINYHYCNVVQPTEDQRFFAARREHAWRLRTNEHVTYVEIARRLGVTPPRVRKLVEKCEHMLKRRGSIHG